jgi:hypothetical protein
MSTHFCDMCELGIRKEESRYTCETCEFDMCLECYFGEKTHELSLERDRGEVNHAHRHPLVERKPKKKAMPFFKYADEHNSKQTIYLSDWTLAADFRKLKELNIKTVLTLMDLKENDDKKESIVKMRRIYLRKRAATGNYVLVSNVIADGIAFHLVDIMDVSDPSLLPNEGIVS